MSSPAPESKTPSAYVRVGRTLRRWIEAFADPARLIRAIMELPRFLLDFRAYSRGAKATGGRPPRLADSHPVFGQRGAHEFDAHYIYLNAWAARRVVESGVAEHIDVGSQLSFTTVLAASLPVTIVEFRPVPLQLSGMRFLEGSILQLPFADSSVQSLSCLHVIEHIGLGRYGDPIDPEGTRKAARELVRVLAPGGRLLVGLPVGRSRVCFNAHRVHAEHEVIEMFAGLRLLEFSGVDDQRRFVSPRAVGELANCEYGCGFFLFTK